MWLLEACTRLAVVSRLEFSTALILCCGRHYHYSSFFRTIRGQRTITSCILQSFLNMCAISGFREKFTKFANIDLNGLHNDQKKIYKWIWAVVIKWLKKKTICWHCSGLQEILTVNCLLMFNEEVCWHPSQNEHVLIWLFKFFKCAL